MVAGRHRPSQALPDDEHPLPSESCRERVSGIGDLFVPAAYTHRRSFRQAFRHPCGRPVRNPAPRRDLKPCDGVSHTRLHRVTQIYPRSCDGLRCSSSISGSTHAGEPRDLSPCDQMAVIWPGVRTVAAGHLLRTTGRPRRDGPPGPRRQRIGPVDAAARRYWYVMMSGGGSSAIMSSGVISGSSLTSLLSMNTLNPEKNVIRSIHCVIMTS